MPKRYEDEYEVSELDDAFRDEASASDNDGSQDAFPEPKGFSMDSPESERWHGGDDAEESEDESDNEVDEAFASEADEFLGGSADSFVDDNQTDYYEYGDKMHNVRADIVAADDSKGKRGRHGAPLTTRDHMDVRQKRSRRMRWVLRVVILLLLVLIAALAYFGYQLYQESNNLAAQQDLAVPQDVAKTAEVDTATHDSVAASVVTTTVPNLVAIMGKNQDEAATALERGATVTVESPVDDPNDPIKLKQTVVLTEEPSDSKSGTPTAYLGFDEGGKAIMAGYSAPTTCLGYGSASFADAVSNEHIIETVLREAGLDVKDGDVKLPEQSQYSTYAEDGKTLVKEQATFEGKAKAGDTEYRWSSVLLYNYTASNASGNLSDTVRTVFVYVEK